MTALDLWEEWVTMATAPEQVQPVRYRVAQAAADVDEAAAILRWVSAR